MRWLLIAACFLASAAVASPMRIEVYDHTAARVAERAERLHLGCERENSDRHCRDLVKLLANQAWFRLTADDPVRPAPAVRPPIRCSSPAIDCMTRIYGEGLWLVRHHEAVWFSPIDGSRARAIWVKQPEIGLVDGPASAPERVYRDLVVTAPELISAMALSPQITRVAGSTNEERTTAFVDHLGRRHRPGPKTRFVLAQPLRALATVICADRITTVGPRNLVEVRAYYQPIRNVIASNHVYALPCSAELVIGAGVAGVSLGPRPLSPAMPSPTPTADGRHEVVVGPFRIVGTPARFLPWLAQCEAWMGEQRVMASNRPCAVPFLGDINGDGVLDVVTIHEGEMECAVTSLWLSRGDYWHIEGSTFIPC